MEINYTVLLQNFLITIIVYLWLPLLSRFILKETANKEESLKYALFSTLLGYGIFFIWHIIQQDGLVPNITVAFVYYSIAYCIYHNSKKDIVEENEKNTTQDNKNIEKNTKEGK